jgi:hypothetical protein
MEEEEEEVWEVPDGRQGVVPVPEVWVEEVMAVMRFLIADMRGRTRLIGEVAVAAEVTMAP